MSTEGKGLPPGLFMAARIETVNVQEPRTIYGVLKGSSPESPTLDKKDLINSMDHSLATIPEPIVLGFVGLPVSGKTHIGRDIVDVLFSDREDKESESAKFEKETGEKIPVYAIYWGDVIMLAQRLGLVEKTKGIETTNPGKLKLITNLYERVLSRLIADNQGKRCLIISEIVGTTGNWVKKRESDVDSSEWADTEFFGFDRGITAFWHMVRRRGKFEGLEYNPYLWGVEARPQIRERGIKFKDRLAHSSKDPQEISKIFAESGEAFVPQNTKEMHQYASESLTAEEAREIFQQTKQLAVRLKVAYPLLFFNMDLERFIYDPDPNYASEVIGEMLLRFVLEHTLKVRESGHAFIAQNSEELPKVKFNTDRKIINYGWELIYRVRKIGKFGMKKFLQVDL